MNKQLIEISDVIRGNKSTEEVRRLKLSILAVKWYFNKNEIDHFIDFEYDKIIPMILDEDVRELVIFSLSGMRGTRLENEKLINTLSELISMLSEEAIIREYLSLIESCELSRFNIVTPVGLRKLMIGFNNDYNSKVVADYFCGYGNFFIDLYTMKNEVIRNYYGQEINNETAIIARVAMKMCGINNFDIKITDTYRVEQYEDIKVDIVLMDAPFASKQLLFEHEVLGYGIPSKMAADWANYQIALWTLSDKGKAIVTAPMGALFRTSDSGIRKGIIEDDRIEAIINLPTGIFPHTVIPTAIIVFNNDKEDIRKNKVLFIDVTADKYKQRRGNDFFTDDLMNKIWDIYFSFEEEIGFSIVVDKEEIAANEYNLNADKYMNERVIGRRLDKSILLSEVADVQTGVQVNKKDLELLKKDATHYYLNVKDLQDDKIEYESAQRIRDKKVNWIGKYDIKSGDLLMTTKGTLTKLVVVPEDHEDAFISNNITRIRIKENKYNPFVLKRYFESELGQLMLESISSGTAVKVINARQLENLQIPVFEKDVMDEVGQRIEDNIVSYHAAIEAATDKFDSEEKEIDLILNFKID